MNTKNVDEKKCVDSIRKEIKEMDEIRKTISFHSKINEILFAVILILFGITAVTFVTALIVTY